MKTSRPACIASLGRSIHQIYDLDMQKASECQKPAMQAAGWPRPKKLHRPAFRQALPDHPRHPPQFLPYRDISRNPSAADAARRAGLRNRSPPENQDTNQRRWDAVRARHAPLTPGRPHPVGRPPSAAAPRAPRGAKPTGAPAAPRPLPLAAFSRMGRTPRAGSRRRGPGDGCAGWPAASGSGRGAFRRRRSAACGGWSAGSR